MPANKPSESYKIGQNSQQAAAEQKKLDEFLKITNEKLRAVENKDRLTELYSLHKELGSVGEKIQEAKFLRAMFDDDESEYKKWDQQLNDNERVAANLENLIQKASANSEELDTGVKYLSAPVKNDKSLANNSLNIPAEDFISSPYYQNAYSNYRKLSPDLRSQVEKFPDWVQQRNLTDPSIPNEFLGEEVQNRLYKQAVNQIQQTEAALRRCGLSTEQIKRIEEMSQ